MNSILYYRPEIIAFTSGALVMIFEILGARIVGPYIGTSLFVWTSLIAIILLALSLGNYFGGKLADKKADLEIVSKIFLLSAASIFMLIVLQSEVLKFVSASITDIRVSSVILALILFTPTSFFLGLIGPVVTKIRMIDLSSGGRVVGKISSISTTGSIIGTLGAGFFLIPFFGVSTLLILLGVLCLCFSLLCNHKKYLFLQIFISFGFLICYLGYLQVQEDNKLTGRHVFDTPYSHVTIAERQNKSIRDLYIDNVTHAGMYLGSNELAYEYTKYYHLFDSFVPEAKNMLMLGGAAYSFPKSFLEAYPQKNLDVVEIDEDLTELAKRFFRLKDDPRLNIYHQDARVFLNNSSKRYDAILGDAFGSYYSIPYQLTTLEVAQKKYDLLNENGAVILNIISGLSPEKSEFLMSEYLTYQQVFPEVFILPVRTPSPDEIQNLMLIALKNPENTPAEIGNPAHQQYLSKKTYLDIPKGTKILTDDYAPVDSMIAKMSIN